MAILAQGEKTVTELVASFDLSQPAISKHLKVLEQAGLIERGREAQWRPARLQAEPLKEAFDWVEQYRRHWEQSFDQLGEYLKSIQSEDGTGQSDESEELTTHTDHKQSDWQMF